MLEIFIRAPRERIWKALTDKVTLQHYLPMNMYIETQLKKNTVSWCALDGRVLVGGIVVASDAPNRLEHTFISQHGITESSKPSRCVYELETAGELTKLTILHYDLTPAQQNVRDGWSQIVSSLKSFLETGEGLKFG